MRKRVRHRVYKEALRRFNELGNGYFIINKVGLCYLFKYCLDQSYYPSCLTEFQSLKPRKADPDGYWWSITQNGMIARRRCLEKCIEMSKPIPKKKK